MSYKYFFTNCKSGAKGAVVAFKFISFVDIIDTLLLILLASPKLQFSELVRTNGNGSHILKWSIAIRTSRSTCAVSAVVRNKEVFIAIFLTSMSSFGISESPYSLTIIKKSL